MRNLRRAWEWKARYGGIIPLYFQGPETACLPLLLSGSTPYGEKGRTTWVTPFFHCTQDGGGGLGVAQMKMKNALGEMFPSNPGVQLDATLQGTLKDPQSGQMGEDILVTLTYPATLIFPGSSYFLSDPPKGSRKKKIIVRVRMPVEKPYFQ